MATLIHLKKEEQELMPLFDGAFIENKPIPFPNEKGTTGYSNLFYWANLEALETAEFPLHPHNGFEIMTFVFKGSLEHFDTATKVWTPLEAGGMQVIQAGSGIQHAERITKGTQLFQIWFDPDFSKSLLKDANYTDYAQNTFKTHGSKGKEVLSYIGANSPVSSETMGLEITRVVYEEGTYKEEHNEDFTYSYYLLKGEVKIDNTLLEQDGFMVIDTHKESVFKVSKKAELFIIKSPSIIPYKRFIQRY